jgi:hypothetical protein
MNVQVINRQPLQVSSLGNTRGGVNFTGPADIPYFLASRHDDALLRCTTFSGRESGKGHKLPLPGLAAAAPDCPVHLK